MSVVTQKFQILIKQIKNAINIYIFNKIIKKKAETKRITMFCHY
jgi:hypothetical protein